MRLDRRAKPARERAGRRAPRALLRLVALAAALVVAPGAGAQDALVDQGRELYARDCISCHGPDARGVEPTGPARGAGGAQGAGPSLRDVGAASAHFYLTTGYMPLRDPFAQPTRGDPAYSDEEIDALVAYVASFGGPDIPDVDPARGDLSEGMRLYTEHCAGCHQMAAEGGVVVGGVVPALERSTPTQIAEAVRVGPYLMPRFGEEELDDRELDSIIRYVEFVEDPPDPGGWGIGHIGPIPEGAVAWLLAGVALVAVARAIGSARR